MNNNENILNILLSSMNNTSHSGESNENSEQESQDSSQSNDNPFSGIDLNMIMMLGEMMSKMNESDKDTDLLVALKPYLRDENKAKMDTAIKLFRLMSMLPLLKESGLFENMF